LISKQKQVDIKMREKENRERRNTRLEAIAREGQVSSRAHWMSVVKIGDGGSSLNPISFLVHLQGNTAP
jgi:hypothetical protein